MSSVPPPDLRPAKRIRQACEPCRRKKSRCPGERPNCSHCSRLGQTCYYASDHPAAGEYQQSTAGSITSTDANRDRHGSTSDNLGPMAAPWGDRLGALENKVAEVLGALNRLPWTASPLTPTPSASVTNYPPPVDHASPPATASTLPPWETIVSVAELYLLYCSAQPLPLFDSRNFIPTLGTRDPEVLFGILAVAVRFSGDPLYRDRRDQAIRGYAEAARTLVMRRVSNGPIELSTLQAFCLLSLVDFSIGNTHRASSLSSLALDLAESAGLSSECHLALQDPTHEERRRCFWSIVFLKKLHGGNCGASSISLDENFPRYPTSTKKPPFSDPSVDARVVQDGVKDEGITAYVVQLSEYWHKAVRYARRRANPGMHCPWSAESEYSRIMVAMMEFESHMPYKHRFRPSKFAERPSEDLGKQRDYWCPWLFSQVIYHTILCLLNHPLILSLRLRNFRVSIPEIFLQHTADLIASHTDWVIHLLDLVEEKAFRVTDPFIGNCVAVVATIYLQQSFADDAGIRNEKRNNFLKCLDFVRRLGGYWPHIAQLATKLQTFESTVSTSYHNSSLLTTTTTSPSHSPSSLTHSNNTQQQSTSVFIDLTTFWEILEAVFTSVTGDTAAGSLFGASLWPPHSRVGGGGGGGGSGGGDGGDVNNSHTVHADGTHTPQGEVVSSRLLPEPTYPRERHGSVATPATVASASASAAAGLGGGGGGGGRGRGGRSSVVSGGGEAGSGGGGGSSRGVMATPAAAPGEIGGVGAGVSGGGDFIDSMALGMAGDNDELAVLAQSYFAQGQDFVRGVDDWWTFGQM